MSNSYQKAKEALIDLRAWIQEQRDIDGDYIQVDEILNEWGFLGAHAVIQSVRFLSMGAYASYARLVEVTFREPIEETQRQNEEQTVLHLLKIGEYYTCEWMAPAQLNVWYGKPESADHPKLIMVELSYKGTEYVAYSTTVESATRNLFEILKERVIDGGSILTMTLSELRDNVSISEVTPSSVFVNGFRAQF